jgi:hypothetical protein
MNSSVHFRKNEDLPSCVGTRGRLNTLMPRSKQVHSNTASCYFLQQAESAVRLLRQSITGSRSS